MRQICVEFATGHLVGHVPGSSGQFRPVSNHRNSNQCVPAIHDSYLGDSVMSNTRHFMFVSRWKEVLKHTFRARVAAVCVSATSASSYGLGVAAKLTHLVYHVIRWQQIRLEFTGTHISMPCLMAYSLLP